MCTAISHGIFDHPQTVHVVYNSATKSSNETMWESGGVDGGGAFLKNNQCFTRLHHSYVYHALCKFASNTTIFTLIPGLRAEPRVTTVKIIHVHLA